MSASDENTFKEIIHLLYETEAPIDGEYLLRLVSEPIPIGEVQRVREAARDYLKKQSEE